MNNKALLSALLETAELKILMFDNHLLRAMNYRNRTFEHYYMMTYVRSGSAKLRIGDAVYDIHPGSVIVIPPHLEHDQYKDTDEETEFLWWHFTYRIHNRIEILPFLNIPYIYALNDRGQFEAVFDEIMRSKVRSGYLPNVILQKAKSLELLYLLLDNAFAQLNVEFAGSQKPQNFLAALLKIVTQPEGRLTLADLAKDLSMNPNYVSNQFKALFGKSPIQLHREVKMERAKQLLEMPVMNIAETSDALGFQDVQSFTRLFKKYVGITPKQYKTLFGNLR
ncbi:AraC family transcriptional regulator [Paenibacillus sp. HB172176]|uniref:helix-turn-helix transcriptional regulator n=1 Tax=Paenibacillus sp. HB172176 TaxID=2493690 RepID=UPI001439EF1F|nr:AraC family transcriptional regulator [Paenibacillus sp. HB172176]